LFQQVAKPYAVHQPTYERQPLVNKQSLDSPGNPVEVVPTPLRPADNRRRDNYLPSTFITEQPLYKT
jgi:hypothetical protein